MDVYILMYLQEIIYAQFYYAAEINCSVNKV